MLLGSRRARAFACLAVAAAGPALGLAPSAQAVDGEALVDAPNLVALPPDDVSVGLSNDMRLPWDTSAPRLVLKFATTVANRASRPLDLRGTPAPSAQHPAALVAGQCVAWSPLGACTRRETIGALDWHQAHLHWHFERFALHELRRLDGRGMPDVSPEGLVVSGAKASFCLEDVEEDGASEEPSPSLYRGCPGVRQGISPGWTDRYGSLTPGQELELDGVPDGRYALVVVVDPDQLIRESSRSDNTAWVVIEVSDGGSQAALVDR